MEPIGVVIRAPSINAFVFRPFNGVEVNTGDFVLIKINGEDMLARVVAVRRKNVAADSRLIAQLDDVESVSAVKEILAIEDLLYFTEARAIVIGTRRGSRIMRPSVPPKPLEFVYRAPSEFVEKQLAPPEEGLYIPIGRIKGFNIPARVNAEKLVTQHCAILASTGAGKSWLAGVIIERLYEAARPSIIVIDPHGEYSAMQYPVDPSGEEIANSVDIYVVGKVDVDFQDREFERRFGRPRRYTRIAINPRSTPLKVLSKLLETLYGLSDAQRRILEEGWQNATNYGDRQPLTSIEELIEEVLEGGRHVAPPGYAGEMALRGLEGRLKALFYGSPVFMSKYGEIYAEIPLKLFDPSIFLKNKIHILDLSGLDYIDQQIFLTVALDSLYKFKIKRRGRPLFIVIEEAHNFAPARGGVLTKPYVAKIAREGRKFGLGLCLISQRPTKLDPDVLSQCMTQIFKRIVNPLDLKYVASVAEHLDAPRQLRNLSETEALVTGVSVPMPLPVEVGERLTAHGGTSPRLNA